MRLFKKKVKKFELNENEYLITPTWKHSSLGEALDAMNASRNMWINRCFKEYGFIPNEIHLNKTSWLLGACLSMVGNSFSNFDCMPASIEMCRNSAVEPGTMMIANTFIRLAVTLERGMVVKRVL